MALTFNVLLESEGISPATVRLLRHTKRQGVPGMTPYQAWRDHRDRFLAYQSTQPVRDRRYFSAPYWAGFVALPDGRTLFVGLFAIERTQDEIESFTCPLTNIVQPSGRVDRYTTDAVPAFETYADRLYIDWGAGTRSWAQYAERRPKPIVELRRDNDDPPYPGHSLFVRQLSEIEALPRTWRAILANARGAYLLTCPRTREQYVGGAYSGGGFLARWEQHSRMEGDAIAFRSREPADYRVSVLEVAGSLTTDDEIHSMEKRWKEKLQSQEMGLNRN